MNKKLKVLFSLTLLLSQAAIANECDTPCEPCEQTSPFCGGYVGANFNFGSVNFLSNQAVRTEAIFEYTEKALQEGILLVENNNKQTCLREALNAIGGGVTLGWAWANSCWYLAAEFNGLFYGNPSLNISNDCDNTKCEDKCCEYTLNNKMRVADEGDGSFKDTIDLTYIHNYKNNVRLDGIVKAGFLANPNTALYILAGGSGLLVKYSESANATNDFSPINDRFHLLNNPNNEFCCNKWIGGGTFGVGLRSSWRNCFDLFVEGRYARYQSTCYSNSQPNDFDDFSNEMLIPNDLSEEDNTRFRTDSYLALVGINWRF